MCPLPRLSRLSRSVSSGIPPSVSLVLLLCLVSLPALPARAGSVYFTPAGSQLDADSILDINTAPGSTLVFTIGLDPAGISLTGPYDRFVVDYSISWDTAELDSKDGSQRTGSVSGLLSDFKLDGTFIRGPVGYTFTVLNPVNDGAADFTLQINRINAFQSTSPFTTLDVTSQFSPASQIVEVQQNAPEPGSLALLLPVTGTLVMVFRRRRRK